MFPAPPCPGYNTFEAVGPPVNNTGLLKFNYKIKVQAIRHFKKLASQDSDHGLLSTRLRRVRSKRIVGIIKNLKFELQYLETIY